MFNGRYYSAIISGFEQYRLITSEKELLQKTLNGSVKLLTDILSLIEPDSFGNSLNYIKPIREIATVLGLTTSWDIELTMMLSDLGKILYPNEIKDKISKGLELNQNEKNIIEKFPETGRNLLSNIPRLEKVSEAIYYSNKNFDGSGFPNDQIKGNGINQIARVVRVLKDYDLQLNIFKDPYKAVQKLTEDSHKYDPSLLEIVTDLFAPPKNTEVIEVVKVDQYDITLEQLCPGQIVLKDITTNDGILLVKTGATISKSMIEKIKNYGSIAGINLPIQVDCLMPIND